MVSDWIAKRDDERRLQLQRDLIATYRDDFNKYRGRISVDLLRGVMDAIPRQRTEGRQGEIDYIIQHGSHVVPVEVKAGKAGAMKSLHAFMHGKHLGCAVRLDINPPSFQEVDVQTTTAEPVRYRLISLPLYMVESIPAAIQSHFS